MIHCATMPKGWPTVSTGKLVYVSRRKSRLGPYDVCCSFAKVFKNETLYVRDAGGDGSTSRLIL